LDQLYLYDKNGDLINKESFQKIFEKFLEFIQESIKNNKEDISIKNAIDHYIKKNNIILNDYEKEIHSFLLIWFAGKSKLKKGYNATNVKDLSLLSFDLETGKFFY
jgi:hypothetical protein